MNHFYTVLLVLVCIAANIAHAQNTLSGKVTDKASGESLPYVSIYIPDLHVFTTTDSTGNYHFEKLPAATYRLQIDVLGFKPFSGVVTINGATVKNFELDESTTELAEVVITGSSKAIEIRQSPISIASVNKQYLTSNISTNIIDAIAKVPGVGAVTTGPNVSKPIIRGLGFNRILTLYDGMRQEGQQWGDEHGIEMDNYAFERVEIIKGPASLMYGSDALAGVVNLIPSQPGAENKISGSVTTEYQSNNGMFGGSVFITGNRNGVEWGARVSQRTAKDFQNPIDGRVYNTGFKQTDVNGFFGVHKKWGGSHLRVSLFDNLQEIPDGSRDSLSRQFTKQVTEADDVRPIVTNGELNSYSISTLHQHVQHYRAYLKNSFFFTQSRLDANIGFQRSVRREFSHPEDPYQNVPGLYLQLNTLTYDVKYFIPEFSNWETVVGANGMYQMNDVTSGTEFVIPSYKQFDFGGFVTIKREFGKLNLSGGARYDLRSFDNQELYTKPNPASGFDQPVSGSDVVGANKVFDNYATTFNGLTGSLGTSYLIDEAWALKLNLSRGYRAPNISEISANGVHPGTNLYQIGNDQFKPEFSNQVDLGASFTAKKVNASASLFVNKLDNYIYNQKLLNANGQDSLSVSGSVAYPTYQFQQGNVLLYGLESNIDFHIIKQLHFDNSVSVIYGDNNSYSGLQKTKETQYVPFMPPVRFISELKYEWAGKSKLIDKPFIKIQVQHTATQNRVFTYDNTETPTQGYTLVNMGAGADFKGTSGKTFITVFLLANNIFDIAYQDHLSRLKYFEQYSASPNGHLGIYSMGRNFSIKLVKNF
ncbi:MAG TPA: TonB-dependent receptor [Cyclobacteriaceae bacterium]|nr:TonB-dependent receptor [Cyclobacteriaceae bacterium]